MLLGWRWGATLCDKNPPSSPGCTGSWSFTVDGVTAETTINNLRDWDFKPSLQLQSASERQHCTSWLSPLIFSLVINTSGNNPSMWLHKGVVARGAMTVNSPTTLGSFSWITHLMKSSSCAQKLFHTLNKKNDEVVLFKVRFHNIIISILKREDC